MLLFGDEKWVKSISELLQPPDITCNGFSNSSAPSIYNIR